MGAEARFGAFLLLAATSALPAALALAEPVPAEVIATIDPTPKACEHVTLPQPGTSIAQLYTELDRMLLHRAELLQRYTELHPEVQLLDCELAILRQQIDLAGN